MNHHVCVLFEHRCRVIGNFHAPRPICGTYDFAQVKSHFCRIVVDGANNFDGLFFAHELRDGCADRSNAVLYGANFLFHVTLRNDSARRPSVVAITSKNGPTRFPETAAHSAHFRWKRNPYDNGIRASIQCENASNKEISHAETNFTVYFQGCAHTVSNHAEWSTAPRPCWSHARAS